MNSNLPPLAYHLETPTNLALDVAAPHVECAKKVAVCLNLLVRLMNRIKEGILPC